MVLDTNSELHYINKQLYNLSCFSKCVSACTDMCADISKLATIIYADDVFMAMSGWL